MLMLGHESISLNATTYRKSCSTPVDLTEEGLVIDYHADLLPKRAKDPDVPGLREEVPEDTDLNSGQVLWRGRHIVTTSHCFFVKWEFVPNVN